MAIFILVPIIFVFRMALSDVSKAGLIKGFAGLENFRKVTSSPVFAMVLKNTLVWTVAVVGISTLLGFILAILLNNEFKGRKLARAVVVFPMGHNPDRSGKYLEIHHRHRLRYL